MRHKTTKWWWVMMFGGPLIWGGSTCSYSPFGYPDLYTGLEEILANSEPISTFDGEWISEEHQFALQIRNRTGVVTLANSEQRQVGDEMLVIVSVQGVAFSGRQVFMDGTIHDVQARMVDSGTINMSGAGWSWVLKRRWGSTPASDPFPVEMVEVPGGGAGPTYSFEIGRFEITNAQFVAFLNDADLDAGATQVGANMFFADNGGVYMSPTQGEKEILLSTEPLDRTSNITFDPTAPRGKRYGVRFGLFDCPVQEVSWYGAVKFCNWLTLREGLGAQARAYTEGAAPADWHPVTISTADWATRDLNEAERRTLVEEIRGYRLPMDNLGVGSADRSSPENAYNEWYKAAAYDPLAPATTRTGPAGETVSPFHWIYPFGRDAISNADANFANSGDPFETDAIALSSLNPVGFYDGVNTLEDGMITNDTNNRYGIYGLGGNVGEWLQDSVDTAGLRAVEIGGSFNSDAAQLAPTHRGSGRNRWGTHGVLGFRVLRVPGD